MASSTDQSDIGKLRTEVDGSFKRLASSFRNFIKNDGQFLPAKGRYLEHIYRLDKQTAQPKRTGRYRLYVSYACRELTSHHITSQNHNDPIILERPFSQHGLRELLSLGN
jgi:glutathionyl-hydroquinone reductase